MARFVKFTHKKNTPSGEETFVYVNVEHVAKAVFDPSSGNLTLVLTAGIPHAEEGSLFILSGKEASDALEVIRSLS